MLRIFNQTVLKCFYHILWMFVIAKTISLLLIFFLPYRPYGDAMIDKISFNQARVSTQRAFGLVASSTKTKKLVTTKPTLLIKDIVLKGIYADKNSSFALLALKKKAKDIKIVTVNDIFNGYKIIKIDPKKVFLQKSGKIYSLYFKNEKSKDLIKTESRYNEPIILRSKDVYAYVNNFDKIWKEIKIDDIRKNGKLKGFVVLWIKSNSIFSKIGLKKGDKIIKVDDKLLKSYGDAFAYYEKIKKKEINILRLTVLRDNKEKEIEYELF